MTIQLLFLASSRASLVQIDPGMSYMLSAIHERKKRQTLEEKQDLVRVTLVKRHLNPPKVTKVQSPY